jgi:CheY-like chemotaxis protein
VAIRSLEQEQGGHTPIVALTASVLPTDKARCLEAGMDDFLTKPLSVPDLRAAVSRWLGAPAAA